MAAQYGAAPTAMTQPRWVDDAGFRGRRRERQGPYDVAQGRRVAGGRDQSGESDSSSIESLHAVHKVSKGNGEKSGMYDKPTHAIRSKLVWPQKQLKFAFITEDVEFKHLTFEHFVAGEIRTIRSCKSEEEKDNRLRLLERISYWKLRGAASYQLRAFYAAFLSSIEAQEMCWWDPLHELESIMIDKPVQAALIKPDKKGKSAKWFCKDFNSARGCSLPTGHKVNIRGEEKEATHMCSKCWEMGRKVKEHSRLDDNCPNSK